MPLPPHLLPLLIASLLSTPSLSEPLQQQPFVLPSSPASTVPAFPEQQSDVASTCPLHLPPEIFPAVTRACSSPSPDPAFRFRCCPVLAAWLFSAYAPSHRSPSSPADLPLLPDDSESCIDSIGKALHSKGVPLPPFNDTCDIPYCFCGIRLRPFSCRHGLRIALDQGRWIARDTNSRQIQRDCSRSTCSRCLRGLYQIKNAEKNATAYLGRDRAGSERDKDCELTSLMWLLATNRTRYLPTATMVLRALMMAPDGKDPTTCAVQKGMPIAVDSADLDSSSASPAIALGFGRPADRRRWADGFVFASSLLVFLLSDG